MFIKTKASLLAIFAVAVSCGHSGKSSFDLDQHIGICTGTDRAEAAKNAGAAYIEIGISRILMPEESDEAYAGNRSSLLECDLPVYSGNGYYPADVQLVGPKADLDRAVAYSEVALARAEEIGLKYAVLGSSKARSIPEGFSREEAEKQFVALLKKLGPIARKHGITIVIEPLRQFETNFINTVKEGAEMARRAGHPNIGVLADFYHMAQENEDPNDIVEAGTLLKHCHIAEAEKRTAPGVAGDDFTPYLKALKKIGYKGGISMECAWYNFDSLSVTAVSELKRQIQSIK